MSLLVLYKYKENQGGVGKLDGTKYDFLKSCNKALGTGDMYDMDMILPKYK